MRANSEPPSGPSRLPSRPPPPTPQASFRTREEADLALFRFIDGCTTPTASSGGSAGAAPTSTRPPTGPRWQPNPHRLPSTPTPRATGSSPPENRGNLTWLFPLLVVWTCPAITGMLAKPAQGEGVAWPTRAGSRRSGRRPRCGHCARSWPQPFKAHDRRVTRWQMLLIGERVPGSMLHLGSVRCSVVVGWVCAARRRTGAGPRPARAGRPGCRAGSRPGRPAPEPAVRSTRQRPHGRAVRPRGRRFGPADRGAVWRNR
jgi:hypothetical protein